MKKLPLLFTFLIVFISYAQKKNSEKLGQVTEEELTLTVYEKDSTANTLVLYEKANVYVDNDEKYSFREDYYNRIKFFNKSDEEQITIKVSLYKNDKIKELKAITYTLEGGEIKKTFLLNSKIFTTQVSENWKEVTFTLPNISDGCVVEYSYSLIHHSSGIKDWYFQSDIPKLKSVYTSLIPGNWRYNARLVGFEKLDENDVSVKKNCFNVKGISKNGDCVYATYGMNDVPAFKEEDYMLAKKNFMSRLSFELESFSGTDGVTNKYTKTWKDADKTIKNLFLDKQTSKKSYFKNKLPEELFTLTDPLEKAKATYYHIQERMHWNDKYWTSKSLKIKRVYEDKKGSVDAINLTLYNALQAVGVESYLVILSTRDNGMPTKLYPAVEDFNYIVVKVVVNNETFFLDATNKFLPFGEVPMRCLNGDVRVLDFKKGSYWEEIKPRFKTSLRTQANLNFNEDKELLGVLTVAKAGYFSLSEKRDLTNVTEDEFLDEFETDHPNIEVKDIEVQGLDNNDLSLRTMYKVKVDVTEEGNRMTVNPFIYNKNSVNPFKLKERNYPVDFGYPRSVTNMITIQIPEGYIVKSLPKNKGVSLPVKGGRYLLSLTNTKNKISLFTKLIINKKIYSSEEYYYLKEFYNQVIKSQKELIVLEKE